MVNFMCQFGLYGMLWLLVIRYSLCSCEGVFGVKWTFKSVDFEWWLAFIQSVNPWIEQKGSDFSLSKERILRWLLSALALPGSTAELSLDWSWNVSLSGSQPSHFQTRIAVLALSLQAVGLQPETEASELWSQLAHPDCRFWTCQLP